MKPTQTLMNEHRVIEQVLDCLQKIAEQCRTEGRLAAQPARDAVDFFRNFADRCHHGKEEAQLFPLMEERGFPGESGPVAVMRMEHEQGRELIRGMEAAIDQAATGDTAACEAYLRQAGAYLDFLREHIQKEDHCLFPMADQAFTHDDQDSLEDRFSTVEREEFGPAFHDKYLGLADALADRYGVVKGRGAARGQAGSCSR